MAVHRIHPSSIQNPDDLQRQVRSIEEQLKLQRLSPATKEQLFCALEGTHQSLQALQTKAQSVGNFAKTAIAKNTCEFAHARVLNDMKELNELKEKIITLYGAIYSRSIDDEMDEIKHETEDLDQSMKSGDVNEISKNVAVLSKHIDFFCCQHRPSRSNRQIIALARQSLKQADTVLFTKVLGPTLNQLNVLAAQKAAAVEEIEDIEDLEPEIMELFETAELFYQHKFKYATSLFNRMSPSLKTRVLAHLEAVGGNPGDLQCDVYKIIQALIAAAHEISHSDDGEGYIPHAEIDRMFQEVSCLSPAP